MKNVTMNLQEFFNFRIEAKEHNVNYSCHILTTNSYVVESDIDFLDYLGF